MSGQVWLKQVMANKSGSSAGVCPQHVSQQRALSIRPELALEGAALQRGSQIFAALGDGRGRAAHGSELRYGGRPLAAEASAHSRLGYIGTQPL